MATILQTTFSNTFSWNQDGCIWNKISLKFGPIGVEGNTSSLVQVLAWHITTIKPLQDSKMTLLTETILHHQGPELI